MSSCSVSVIIPVYNAGQYLIQTLACITGQTLRDIEIICVDDGSTDNSLSILRDFARLDPRVRVLTQANAGAGAARNRGLREARGEYLSFLDADDIFEPDMLRLACDQARAQQADIAVFRCDNYYGDTDTFDPARYTIQKRLLPSRQPFPGSEIPKDIFKAFVGWAWDKLFRAEFIRENDLWFQEQRTTNDLLFVYSAIVRARRITTLDTVLVHHRRDRNSLSVTREKSWDCCYRALLALRGQLRDWSLYEKREQDFINYSLNFLLWNLNSLQEPSFTEMFDALTKGGWLSELGIPGHEKMYYYRREDFDRLQLLLTCGDAAEYRKRIDAADHFIAGKLKARLLRYLRESSRRY